VPDDCYTPLPRGRPFPRARRNPVTRKCKTRSSALGREKPADTQLHEACAHFASGAPGSAPEILLATFRNMPQLGGRREGAYSRLPSTDRYGSRKRLSSAEAGSATWRKSGSCMPSECVEVTSLNGQVLVRDSADRSGPLLSFEVDRWNSFLQRLANDKTSFITHGPRFREAVSAMQQADKEHSSLLRDESLVTRPQAAAA
jgi:hypothetical protein